MADKIFPSTAVTFVDMTDSRILDVYISANHPTVQICNSNTTPLEYTPDWSVTNLKLEASFYLDSTPIIPESIEWSTRIGTTETTVGTEATLNVNTNVLENNPIITYKCKITYDNNTLKAFKEITFTRVDTGLNGSNGQDGTSVTILGSYNTLAELQTAHPTGNVGDAYIIGGNLYVWAVDDAEWENVGNIQGPAGADGRNAKNIILTGDSQVFKVSKTNVITPSTIKVTAYTFNTTVTNWTYSTNGGQTFKADVPTGVSRNGNIVTITGSAIESNSIVIKASDGEVEDVFTIYKAIDGSDGSKGTDGAPAPITFLTNENVTFSANAQGQIATTTITSNIVAYEGTTKVKPILRTDENGNPAITGVPNGMSITTSEIAASNEIMLTITITNDSTLGSTSNNMGTISIPIISPVSTTLYLTWSKVNSGAIGVGIKSTTVTYGVSDSVSTNPIDIEWQSTIPTVEEGKYLWTRTIIDYTDDAIADTVTYTYSKQGIKGDTGSTGSSVTVSSIQYQEGASATIPPTNTWSNFVVTVAEGKFLWTKTAFSDGKTAYGVARQGVSGKDGVGINSITIDYGASDSATVKPTTWQQNIPVVAEGKYLWTRTITDYTDTSKADTVAYVYAKQGAKGDTGTAGTSVTVKSIKYQTGTSATVAPTGTWSDSVVAVAEGSYLWTQTTFSDNKVAYGVAKQGQKGDKGDQGVQGPKGNDAYTVMLTNESHTFAGDVSNAIAGTAETQVLAYNGSTQQSVTIVSVDGKTASTSDTNTNIAGLKFKCSALSGTSPTITFTCTTSFVSKSGSIPIVLSVGGVQFTKMFTYSIAFKGSTGAQGTTGQTGTPASLVDITPSAHYFKSTTGKDGTFTPDYIYLYPRFQTVTFSKWEYSVNGGTTWVAASGANGLSIGTYNSVANTLRIAKTSTLYTDTVTSISFRCVSSNASVYDTVSIAKIYDVVDLQIGGRNLLQKNNLRGHGCQFEALNETYNGVPTFKITANLDNTGNNFGFAIKNPVEITNGTYTVSYWYKFTKFGATTGMSGYVRVKYSDDSEETFTSIIPNQPINADNINKWFKIEQTFTTNVNKTVVSIVNFYFYKDYALLDDSAIITYPKIETGNKATDWSPAPEDLKSTTFQLYAPKGYLITNDVPEITLETFAYDGSQPITDATFAWSSWNGEAWTAISSATSTSLTLNKSNVLKSGVYKCDMTYGDKVYTATATVEDKTDVYDSLIHVTSKYSPTNRLYWVLYSTVYSEEGEKDELLGPVSVTAPMSPTTGAYWYKIDETNYTVTLMKYSETAWAVSTDKQEFVYDWFMLNDTNNIVTLGERSKVKIVTADNFSRTCSVQCNVLDQELAALTHSNQVLNDPSDPIVSETEPSNPINGQLWIKTNASGSYMLLVWDASNSKWVVSEADTQKKVYVSKPTTYNDGDIWIVASEYEPDSYIDGVLQTEVVDGVTKAIKHLAGTMLIAQYGSETYKDSDWVSALNYKKEINKLKENLDAYNQFFTFDNTGMTMKAKNLNGQISEFSTKLTNNELGFYQGENKVAYINNNQLNISKAEITNGMVVGGDAPMIQIGNFVIMQESNGSLSIGLKS